ncbi:hypothetical protein K0U91_01260 [Chryseobacterium chendengshani]|uniref:hypothetical protein n=1 Tax=Chryseobacterium sp. LJ668 TaxID=2864040 RepID=UPI001C68D5A3|nr:hypothetical protein [Chryseobacterium sp. LJ668]MBW8523853.1 hypothetical protein [Chryseobacterium sp. LJ668]QYK16796.1 hypothetical protein K0U91_01260 [Chryseobacterium sp. LJ668]
MSNSCIIEVVRFMSMIKGELRNRNQKRGDLLLLSELSEKAGMDIKINRFFITGEGNIKYTYNNGIMASDSKLASMNFLNALEKIPELIKQEEKKIKELRNDIPILSEIIKNT